MNNNQKQSIFNEKKITYLNDNNISDILSVGWTDYRPASKVYMDFSKNMEFRKNNGDLRQYLQNKGLDEQKKNMQNKYKNLCNNRE